MSTSTIGKGSPSAGVTPSGGSRPTQYPIHTWALVGAVCIALEAWVLGAWIISGQATPTATGPTPVPTWMAITAHSFELLASLAWVVLVVRFVILPRRQLKYIPADGRLLLGLTLIFWLDPLLNYFQNVGTYNAVFFNLGSWVDQFPGSTAPRANLLAEPIFFVIPAYAVFVFSLVKFGVYVMKRGQTRWPTMGRLRLVAICFVIMMLCDFVLEMSWLQLGYYTFAGTIRDLTLFAGHTYQFPLYESVFTGVLFTGFACIRHFTDDKDEMYVERGQSALTTTDRRRSLLRFVALYGAMCTLFLLSYDLPMAIIGANTDAWSQDVVERSYLNDGICGLGTPYHCPGPTVPIPRDGSAYIAPDGSLTGPSIAPEPAH